MLALLVFLYALFAVMALVPTLIEQRVTARRSLPVRIASLFACLFWPVTVLCLAAHLGWQHRQEERVPARA